MIRRVSLLVGAAWALALFAGCGRSSLLGGDDCPTGSVRDITGDCVPLPETPPDHRKAAWQSVCSDPPYSLTPHYAVM